MLKPLTMGESVGNYVFSIDIKAKSVEGNGETLVIIIASPSKQAEM